MSLFYFIPKKVLKKSLDHKSGLVDQQKTRFLLRVKKKKKMESGIFWVESKNSNPFYHVYSQSGGFLVVESLLKTDSTMLWSSVIAEEWNKFAMGKGHLPRRKEINMKADLQHLINMECLSLYLINRLNRDYFNCSPVQALFANNIKNDWFSNEKHQISFWFAVNLIGPGSSVQVSKWWKWQSSKWWKWQTIYMISNTMD